MIKKIITNSILLSIFLIIIFFISLATVGIETSRFNKLISEKITKAKNIDIKFNTIKFKLDPKELSLFLETSEPRINYKNLEIPANYVKVYIDFLSLLKTNLKIEKISLNLNELNIRQLNQLSKIIKPSNFKSFLNNNVLKGKLISEIEFFLNDKGEVKNYIAKGSIKDLEANLLNDLNLSKINLNFFADKEDILLKNISGNILDIVITNGDAKLNLEKGIELNSNFDSQIDIEGKTFVKFSKIFSNYNFTNKIKSINGKFSNSFSLYFDETYKLKKYKYKILGKVNKGSYELSESFKNEFFQDEIKNIYFSDLLIDANFSSKNYELAAKGNYSINNLDFLKINFKNKFDNNLFNFLIDFDYKNNFELNLINYKKSKNSLANLLLEFETKDNKIFVKNFHFKEDKNSIKINGIDLKDSELMSFNKIEVSTLNNNFVINNRDKIMIKGNKLDATNLTKFLNKENNNNKFSKFSKNIEINLKNIKIPMSEKLEDFTLIGEIYQGKFIKIASKGDFGGDNFLEISMKGDKKNNKKYLEIYSDLTRPLLNDYSFFKGLSGGKLLFTSLIDDTKSTSKLNIENFKVIDAPGVIKLLSLADLSGLEDLAKGEGLTFDLLEINLEKSKNFLKINEILALGPSVSVLMEGYQDAKGITSLRGTLVPAKTLNKMISKIPVIGNIVIPKEVGEGLFGVSFKMKGPKGNIKTTINPIRTLTPRFIQKIVDKNKN